MPKFFFGEVIKRSSAKTIKVLVRQMVWNKKIQKRLLRRTKLMTHDPGTRVRLLRIPGAGRSRPSDAPFPTHPFDAHSRTPALMHS